MQNEVTMILDIYVIKHWNPRKQVCWSVRMQSVLLLQWCTLRAVIAGQCSSCACDIRQKSGLVPPEVPFKEYPCKYERNSGVLRS